MKNQEQEKIKCCENCLIWNSLRGTYCARSDCPCHKPFSKEEYHMRERPDAAPQEEKKKCKYCNTPLLGRNEEDCSQKSKEVKCCEECGSTTQGYHTCYKKSTPTLTSIAKEEEDWEKEFDKFFSLNEDGNLELNFTDDTPIPKTDLQLLKGFIHSLIVKEKEAATQTQWKAGEKVRQADFAEIINRLKELHDQVKIGNIEPTTGIVSIIKFIELL